MGIIPLYMGWDKEGNFFVASELKALESYWQEIKLFPPGHYFSSEDGQLTKWYQRDWKNYENVKDNTTNISRLRESLSKAVKRQLMSDVPYGVLLSGGLDSSLIFALAKNKFPKLKTYSIGFEDDKEEKGSEFFYSDQVAKKFNTNHKKFRIDNKFVLSKLPSAFKSMSEPMVAQDAVAFYMLSELVSKDVKVVLSGQGADEGFGGYLWSEKIKSEANNYENFLKHYADRTNAEIKEFLNIKFSNNHTSEMVKD